MKKTIALFAFFALLTSCDPSMTVEELWEKMKGNSSSAETFVAESENNDEPKGERATIKDPLFNDLMLPQSSGVFRGVVFDMTRDEVYEIETKRSTISVYKDETDEELVFTTDMGKEVLDFADITYKFDEKGLYWIKVETYITTAEKANQVYDEIKNHFTEQFGEPTQDEDGYDVFEASDRNSGYDYKVYILNIDDVEDSYGMYMYFEL